MVSINLESTKDMLKNTESDFLVHKGSYDRIYDILKNKHIPSKKFTSFSDGIPFIPLHGDSIIVFDKHKLIEKDHLFLKIKYDLEVIVQDSDLLEHLMEGKSEDELLNDALSLTNVTEEKYKAALKNASVTEKKIIRDNLANLNLFRKRIKTNPMDYFLETFKQEKEVVSLAPFDFDSEDVLYVVSNFLMQKYYEIPPEFNNKVLFLEDYCSPTINLMSPLASWIENKKLELEKSGVSGINEEVFLAFQILNGIIANPSWRADIQINPCKLFGVKIPAKWDEILKNMHNYSNTELKMSVIDYIFRIYVLRRSAPITKYENFLYTRISHSS